MKKHKIQVGMNLILKGKEIPPHLKIEYNTSDTHYKDKQVVVENWFVDEYKDTIIEYRVVGSPDRGTDKIENFRMTGNNRICWRCGNPIDQINDKPCECGGVICSIDGECRCTDPRWSHVYKNKKT